MPMFVQQIKIGWNCRRNVSIEDEAHKEGEESGSRNWEPKPQPEYVSLRVFYVIVGILTSATMFVVLMSALIVLAARGDPNGEPPSSTLSPDQMSIWVIKSLYLQRQAMQLLLLLWMLQIWKSFFLKMNLQYFDF